MPSIRYQETAGIATYIAIKIKARKLSAAPYTTALCSQVSLYFAKMFKVL